MSELDEIRKRYESRKTDPGVKAAAASGTYSRYISNERQKVYARIILEHFQETSGLKFLEIGAGDGSNLPFFHSLGIPWENISANELLEDRMDRLREKFPEAKALPGDALQLPFEEEFDIVFQSTVFTSILDPDFRKNLASKMWRMLKPGGMVLWYDFVYNNPSNKDVKGVPLHEVLYLFPEARDSNFYRVTLAPPIGRRIGKLYPFFNVFPFLRTHVVVALMK